MLTAENPHTPLGPVPTPPKPPLDPMPERPKKYNAILLLFIGIGLWMNAIIPLFHPQSVAAQDTTLSSMNKHLDSIEDDIHRLATGVCVNRTLCR